MLTAFADLTARAALFFTPHAARCRLCPVSPCPALLATFSDFRGQIRTGCCWTERMARAMRDSVHPLSVQDPTCLGPIHDRHTSRIAVPDGAISRAYRYSPENPSSCPSMAAVYAPGTQFPVPHCPSCMLSTYGVITAQTGFACSQSTPGTALMTRNPFRTRSGLPPQILRYVHDAEANDTPTSRTARHQERREPASRPKIRVVESRHARWIRFPDSV